MSSSRKKKKHIKHISEFENYDMFNLKHVKNHYELSLLLDRFVKTFEIREKSKIISEEIFNNYFHIDDQTQSIKIKKINTLLSYEKYEYDNLFDSIFDVPDIEDIILANNIGNDMNKQITSLSDNNLMLYYYETFAIQNSLKNKTIVYRFYENLEDPVLHDIRDGFTYNISSVKDEPKHELYKKLTIEVINKYKNDDYIFDFDNFYMLRVYEYGILIYICLKIPPKLTAITIKDKERYVDNIKISIKQNNLELFKIVHKSITFNIVDYMEEIIYYDRSNILEYLLYNNILTYDETKLLINKVESSQSNKCINYIKYYKESIFESKTEDMTQEESDEDSQSKKNNVYNSYKLLLSSKK